MSWSRPGRTQRTTGVLVALALALILAGVVLLVAMASRSGPGGVGAATSARSGVPGPTGPAPSLQDVPDITDVVRSTERADVEFEDSKRPGRVAGRLSWQSLEPLPGGYADVVQPRAWIYLVDGRAVHVRADNGRLRMPGASQAPESGTFDGGVVVKMFAPRSEGEPPIDPDRDAPGLLAYSNTMTFDSLLGEIATPDLLTVETAEVEFQGTGVLARFNQIRERIEYLRVASGKQIVIHPRTKKEGGAPHAAAAPRPAPVGRVGEGAPADTVAARPNDAEQPGDPASPAAPTPMPQAADAASDVEEWYRAVFNDDVKVTRGGATLDSEVLRVWAHVVNNTLAADALGPSKSPQGPDKPVENSRDRPRPAMPAASVDSESPAAATDNGAEMAAGDPPLPEELSLAKEEPAEAAEPPVVITWAGPLILTPLDARPPELEKEEVALRFSSERSGLVRLADPRTGAQGWCGTVEYGATTRSLVMTGPSPVLVPELMGQATLDVPRTAKLRGGRIEANLATGVASIPGAGMLASSGESPAADVATGPEREVYVREISWSDRADLKFRTREGAITSGLEWAGFAGSVRAHDRSSTVTGEYLRAEFHPVNTAAGARDDSSVISRLLVDGRAVVLTDAAAYADDPASDVKFGTMRAETLDVRFRPRPERPDQSDPVLLVGTGGVFAGSKGETLSSESLEADLMRDDKGETVVARARARGSVLVSRPDGTGAEADEVIARPLESIADLIGERVLLSKDAVSIEAQQVHLDGARSEMIVFGRGRFEMETPYDDDPTELGSVTATWTKAMRFDDIAGRIDCTGDAEVISTRSRDVVEKVKSERLIIDITPASEARAGVTTVQPTPVGFSVGQVMSSRRLLRAEAIGSILEREDGRNAEVEMRRYEPRPDEGPLTAELRGESRRLIELFYLDGGRIIADERAGTISVPVPGQSLIVDRRPRDSAPPPTPTPTPGTGASLLGGGDGGPSGTSRFTWGKSALFTRATGVLELGGDVELLHRPLPRDGREEPITRLISVELRAVIDQQPTAAGAEGRPVLRSAEAIGAAYAERDGASIVADRLFFDAPADTVIAGALEGSRVTLMDGKQPTPVTAKRLLWNLRTGRIEILEAAPITSPR